MESPNTISSNSSQPIDWDALRRLRAKFLEFGDSPGTSGSGARDYWSSERELASYDATFAERIGWKWDAVLSELQKRGWNPPIGTFLDWGCGTGVAGRRVADAFPDQCRTLNLWDRSEAARKFALRRARTAFPRLDVRLADSDSSSDLLLVSHVINELSREGLERLLAVAQKATAVIWVEPGTASASRLLIEARSRLLETFRPVAPCPHALTCGMLTAGNESHWCHHFATPPAWAYQDSSWGRFAKIMEIDFGTVPFSYLVLDRRPAVLEEGLSRLIGRPRHFKGFDKLLCCEAEGVNEWTLQKRDSASLHKEMKKDPGTLYRWQREGEKIRSGERLV